MPLILGTNSIKGGYEVANSLRFNDGSSEYLNRTLGTPTNNKKWTLSFWFKKTVNGANPYLFTAYNSSTNDNRSWVNFQTDDTMSIAHYDVSAYTWRLVTNRLFRDPSAWYHIVVAVDTTQGTAANRVKLYVNGVQETSFSTASYPDQNYNPQINSAQPHNIGRAHNDSAYVDGYMAETVFIDGQQLTPTSFGEFDEDSPTIWKPKGLTDDFTFGTNGFHLDFENSSSLGADVSGNSNNFTVNNLTAIDQTTDTCTNNFSTMNPLDNYYFSGTFSEGNLKVATNSGVEGYATNTMPVSTGKWYWEMKIASSGSNRDQIGIADKVIDNTDFSPISGNNRYEGYYGYTGNHYSPDTGNVSYGATFTAGDIVGVALDLVNHKLYFHKNGTYQNSGDPTSGSTGTGAIAVATDPHDGVYYATFANIHNTASTFEANFGNPVFTISSSNSDGNGHGNFEYAVPSGYFALCSKNLAEFG